MNPPSRRSTRENAINKEATDATTAPKFKSKLKPAIISYDYDAAISQPDIPSKIHNNTQNPSWSDSSKGLEAPSRKRNLYTRGKANHMCNVEIKKESIPSSEIRDTGVFEKEKIDAVTASREASPSFVPYQKNLKDIQKRSPEVVENDKNFMNVAPHDIFQETRNSYNVENSNKINKDAKLYISQNKTSKIPRIKPDYFPPVFEESHIYLNRKVPIRNKVKYCINIKSPTECNEEKNEFEKILKKETVKADSQTVKNNNMLHNVHKDSVSFWNPEKSSEMDADEEFEEDSPTMESPLITGNNTRSAKLLQSLALKCDCHTQCTETESWSSPETERANRWKNVNLYASMKSMKHRKVIDMDSEDLDLISNYKAINYKNVRSNRKNNRMTNLPDHVTKSSLTKPAKLQTYQTTNLSFFNVFFDIVFWPFVFLRAKQ